MFRENWMHWTDGRIYRRTVQQLTRPLREVYGSVAFTATSKAYRQNLSFSSDIFHDVS